MELSEASYNDRVSHKFYGAGTILEIEWNAVAVEWDGWIFWDKTFSWVYNLEELTPI